MKKELVGGVSTPILSTRVSAAKYGRYQCYAVWTWRVSLELLRKTRVLVLMGSRIGSFYAFILERTKRVRLTVVARSNYEAVKKNVGALAAG